MSARSRPMIVGLGVAVAALVLAGTLFAFFNVSSTPGSAGGAAADTVNQGETPSLSSTGHTVHVSWTASTLAGGDAVDGYIVKRYDAGTDALQVVGTGCNGSVAGTNCDEIGVPTGSWKYTITPVVGTNWRGPESVKSGAITISATTLTLTKTTLGLSDFGGGTTDATLTGSLTGFVPTEGITYRLDAGTSLSGTPSSVDGSGNASVSITLPRPSDGAHTIYALGDASPSPSESSAAILVDTTPPTVSASLSPAANGAGWNNSTPVSVSLSADEGIVGSGVAEIKYTTDGSDPTTSGTAQVYSGSFDVSASTSVKFFATDAADNASDVETQEVLIDTDVPASDVSLDVSSGNALLSGTTLWYRGVDAGSLTLSNALTDTGDSGVASTGYAALSGTSTGFFFSSSSVTTGPPYVSNALSWDAGTTSSPSETVTGYDVADNFDTTTLTFTDDSAGPTGGSVDASGLVGTSSRYSTSTDLSIAFSKGTDAGVGLAASGATLSRAEGTLSSSDGTSEGTCAGYGAYVPVATDPSTLYADTVPDDNACYKYQYAVSDKLGSTTTYTSGDVKVQTSPPVSLTPTVTLSSASGNTFISGTTVYTNPQAGKSGSFVASAAPTDAFSGIEKVNFPSLTGFTSGGGDVGSSPSQTTYNWSGAGATASGSKTLTATDNASLTATAGFTLTPDTTAPSGGSVDATGLVGTGSRYSNTKALSIEFTKGSDSGSGLAASGATLWRQEGTLSSSGGTGDGACTSYGSLTQIGASDPSSTVSNTVPDDNACYRFQYRVPDNVGNIALYTSGDIKVETAAPVSQTPTNATIAPVTGSAFQFVSGSTVYYNPAQAGSFTVSSSASDAFSGIGLVTFPDLFSGFSGGGNVTSPTSGTTFQTSYSWSNNVASASPGAQSISATDNATLSATKSTAFTVTKDDTAPTTTDNSASIGNAWKNTSQTVTLSPTDNIGGSGVANTYYTTNGSTPSTSSSQGTSVGLTSDGLYTVKYFSVDNVSNTESVETADTQIRIDKTNPTPGSFTLPSFIANGATLTNAATDATVNGASSAVASVSYYYCAGTSCTPSTLIGTSTSGPNYSVGWTSQPTDGPYRVLARVTDNAGNVADSSTVSTSIDNANPTITASAKNADNSTYTAGTWTNQTVTVHYTCGDGGSGIASCPADQTFSAEGVTNSTSGTATDNVGNQASASFGPIKIDKTKPTTSLTTSPASPDGTNSWFKQTSASFTLSASDGTGTSGVATSFYTIDGGGTQIYSTAVTINTQGDHTVTFWSVDTAGTVENTNTTHIKIDNILPATTIATTPSAANGSNGWFVSPNSSVSFTLSATDSTSGVANRFYTIDGGATQTYSGAVTVNINGDHTILYWSTDNAGNIESQHEFHIKIDTTPPTNVLSLTGQSTKTGPAGAAVPTSGLSGTTLYYDGGIVGSLKIRNALTDAHSGPASGAFAGTTSDSKWTALGNGTVSAPTGGPFDSGTFAWNSGAAATFTETVTGADNAGNGNTGTGLVFTNDKTDPGTPVITFPAAGGDYSSTSWDAGSCATGTICGTASDAGSGIAKVQVSIKATSGANINKYWDPTTLAFTSSTEVLVLASGTTSWSLSFPSSNFSDANYSVTAYTSDFANNFKSVAAAFAIDNVAPTPAITFPVNGTTYDATSWAAGATSKITGTASDPLSGVASDQIAIQRGNGNYWNGTSFSSSAPFFLAASGTTSWTLAFAATNFPSDSAYTVYARSTDVAGNVSTSVTSTFNYDNTNPTVTMTFPAASGVYNASSWNTGCTTAGVCGSATDPSGAAFVSGVASVTVSIKDTTTGVNKFWNGTSFANTSETFFTATGTTSWSLAFAASNLVSGHTFQVHAHVTDSAGNTADVTNGSIVYDNTAPTVTPVAIQKSSGGAAGFVSQGGTYFVYANVADTGGSNVSTVIANASSVTAGASPVALSTTGGPWTIGAQTYNYRSAQLTANNPQAEGSYSFSVTATDGAANQTSLLGNVTVDNTGPASAITFPANSGNYNTAGWTGPITGTAFDASAGVASVAVTIQQQSTGKYWSGTGFASVTPVSFTAAGTTSWSLTFAAANFTVDGTYVVTSAATDNADTVQATAASNTFVVDKTLPTAGLAFPASGGNYNTAGWTGSLAGTASDATSGLSKVEYAVQQGTGNYWNGTSFSSATAVFLTASGTSTWSQTFPMSNFPADGSYTVSAKSTDAAGNVSTVVSNTFKVDNTRPTSAITFPANNGNYNTAGWSGSISGTASDATAGVASVALTIQQQSTGNYWNGSAFASVTPVSLSPSGTTSWSLTFAAANFTTDGTYIVTATATDSAGNVQSPTASNTFVFDKTNPTASIAFPSNSGNYNTAGWTGSITGTASDATSGLTTVQYAVQQGSGNYWNGTSFGSATPVFFTATGTTSWSASFAAANFSLDGSYTVYAKSNDVAGNVSTTVSNTFKVDKANPTAAVAFPAANGNYNTAGWSGSITGTASDSTSGVGGVQIAVQQASGNYWNPLTSQFDTAAQTFFAATGTTSWSSSFPASNFPADGSYTVYAKSTDAAGNVSTIAPNVFKIDNTRPTSSIAFPADGGNYNTAGWAGSLSGTASDATAGVTNVAVTIQQQSSGNYWNGTGFTSASPVSLTATGTTSWSLTFAAANFATDGTYVATATATDSAGNVQSPPSSNTFVIDKTNPSVSITYPTGGNYTNATWSGSLTGTAGDATSGVTSVQYAVQQGSGNYWNGTGFSSATAVFLTATGTTSWSASFAASNFPADGSYTVYAKSTDAANNVSTVTNTFKIDNAAPTSSITFPANTGYYNTAGWSGSISGTGSDATSGIASVAITIQQQSTGNYWNGIGFSSSTPVPFAATGTTTWSLSFAVANFTTDGTYVVTSTAADNAGNVQTSSAANTFFIDKTNPTAAITFPADGGNYNAAGWSGSIAGTASDATSGVATVQYALQQGTGNYWNGTTFGSGSQFFFAATGTTGWSAAFAVANFTVDGTYTVYAKSTDAAGNVSTTVSNTFKVDKTNPTAAVTFPASSGNYNTASWTGSLTGTATDATSGVAGVQVAIQQGSGNYWNPATGLFDQATQTFFAAAGTSSWSYSFAVSNFPADGSYTVYARSTDVAGNTGTATSSTFKFDDTAPTSAITFPANSANYRTATWTGSITGSAADATSGLANVKVTIQQQTSGNYWNGTGFASGTPVLLTASGTTSWTFALTAASLTDSGYTVTSTAIDAAGNTQSTPTSSTFIYDTTSPTNALSLVGQGAVGGNPTSFLSGTKIFYKGNATGGRTFQIQNALTDALSGAASSTFGAFSGNGWTTLTSSVVSTPSGGPYVSGAFVWNSGTTSSPTEVVTGTDAAGNSTVAPTLTLTNDITAATTTATLSPTANGSGWTTADTTVSLNATDGTGSGIASITYSATGAQTIATTTAPGSSVAPVINTEGTTIISYFSTDNVGNIETTKTVTVKLDKSAPDAPTMTTAPSFIKNGQALTVSSATDNGPSGVASESYFYCAGTGCTPTTSIGTSSTPSSYSVTWSSMPADGTYTIAAKTTDTAGNVSILSATQTVTVDNTLPTVTDVTLVPVGTANGLAEGGEKVTITYSEAIKASTFCSTWTTETPAALTDVTVTIANSSGSDPLTVSSPTCTFRLATVVPGDYVSGTTTFTSSSIAWDSSAKTLTITLGTLGTNARTSHAAKAPTYTPPASPNFLTDFAGNALAATTFTDPQTTGW